MINTPRIVFHLFGLPITNTVTNTWIIMALITVFCWFGGRNLKKVPGKFQTIVEMIVSGINGLTKSTMGEKNIGFAPYMGALAIFLAIANLSGLVGLRPPTADLNTTLALALLTFFLTQFFGIKSKGVGGYLKGFFEPMPFLLPLNIIGELANPVSLSFRLFGNMLGGLIIMGLLYSALMGLFSFLGIGIPIIFHLYFDVFSGLLQTFIFVMLSMVFISMAMD